LAERGGRTAHILTIVGTRVAHEINPRAYLHLATKMLVNGWPHSKLRDLLAAAHPNLLLTQDDPIAHLQAIDEAARLPPRP